jgi:ADP-heptose:LPS heptosyltransferase
MIEPHVKTIGHQNKAWIWARWIELAQTLRKIDHQTVQCGVPGTEFLAHAATAVTPTFRLAAAVLSVAKAFIGTEGGLMHAAAAVGTPAVILWAEFISPEITGYSSLKNLRHAGKPCGMRVDCPGCRKSMEAITVDEVIGALKEILK